MVKHISIWRLVAAITAGGLICGAVYWSFKYRRMDREFLEWVDARPLDAAVDLSRPGKVTARFHQTCQVSHGEEIYLAVKPAADRSNSTLLQGLDGVIRINDIDGKEIQVLKLTSEVNSAVAADEPIKLAYFHPFAKGDYTATIDIKNGAAALDGLEQRIYAKYALCGCEHIPAAIAGFFAFVFGIPGLIMAVIVTRGFIKYGLAKPHADDTKPTCAAEPMAGPVTG